jgi:hypothetical protein
MARTPDLKAVSTASIASTRADVAPRFAGWWAALVYAVATMTLAYPALSGRFLVNVRSDQYKIGYAFREYAAAWLRAGHGFPQWNPYLFGGLPYVAAMHGDIFYPTFLLRTVLPTDAAMTWEFPIHVFLAGLFTYGFLRAWRFGFMSALIGGLAYMLSGQIVSLASPGHDGKLFVSALLPLALWMLTRGVRDGRAWSWGVLAFTIGLAVLSPHPQLLQYMLLCSGAFALYLAFGNYAVTGALPRDVALKRLGLALGAVIIGALIGAVQFYPVMEYTPFSPRAGGRGYDYATTFSMPIEELINTYLPQFSGVLDHYWGRNNIHFHSEYIGAAVLVLFGACFGATARKSFRQFWLVTGVVAMFWALGGYTPFYHLVYAIIPGTHYFRAPSTIFYLVAFSIATLSAIGVERVLEGIVTPRYTVIWIAAAAAVAVLVSVGAVTVIGQGIITSAGATMPQQLTDLAMQRMHGNNTDVILGAWRSFLVVLVAAGLIWAFATDRVTRRVVAWGLVVVVALDLWSVEHLYWMFSPPAAALYAGDQATDYIANAKEPGRVLVLPVGQLPGLAQGDPTLNGCSGGTGGPTLMVHRIRNVTGCHGNELGRYQELGGFSDTTQEYDSARYLSAAGAQHENIQYLLTNAPDTVMTILEGQLHTGSFTKILGPVNTAAGSTVYLYRFPGANPLSWVAASMVKGTPEQSLATVLAPGFDPARAAILDSNSTLPAVSVNAVPAAAQTHATATSYAPGAIDLTLDQPASAGQALIVSENYFPGWKATADGKPAAVERMDFNLIGVALPAGARSIQLRFTDAAYETGKWLTVAAGLVALIWWLAGLAADRRRAVPVA